MDINYAIIDSQDIDEINFNELLENTIETLRYSVDESKFIIKWIGETPSFLPQDTIIYTNSEILPIVNTEEWMAPEKPID
jgi:hypothetical protein